jgi:hypothetical protein
MVGRQEDELYLQDLEEFSNFTINIFSNNTN